MTLSILIPVKSFAQGKTRLASVLTSAKRAALGREFLLHVLGVASQFISDAHIYVVSPCADVLAWAARYGATAVVETAPGHNPALEHAMAHLPADSPVLILSADLPLLHIDDLIVLKATARDADVVVATDHAQQGTNGLWLPGPGAIPMRFGPGSRAAHASAAAAVGLKVEVIVRPGLARDIDLPADLKFLPLSA